jgi:hypothetical protein
VPRFASNKMQSAVNRRHLRREPAKGDKNADASVATFILLVVKSERGLPGISAVHRRTQERISGRAALTGEWCTSMAPTGSFKVVWAERPAAGAGFNVNARARAILGTVEAGVLPGPGGSSVAPVRVVVDYADLTTGQAPAVRRCAGFPELGVFPAG